MPCPYLAVLPTCRLADLHGGGGTRTHDLAVKSRMLYQLSYAPGPRSRSHGAGGRRKSALVGAPGSGIVSGRQGGQGGQADRRIGG